MKFDSKILKKILKIHKISCLLKKKIFVKLLSFPTLLTKIKAAVENFTDGAALTRSGSIGDVYEDVVAGGSGGVVDDEVREQGVRSQGLQRHRTF